MNSKIHIAIAFTCALVTFAGAARAQEPEPPLPKKPRWYGWQVLVADTAAIGTTTVGVTLTKVDAQLPNLLIASGVVGYAFASPIVHWSKGHVGRGFASLGLHVGSPLASGLVGGLLGSAIDCTVGCGEWGGWGGFLAGGAIGFSVGAVAATAVDSAVLARDEEVVEDAAPETSKLQLFPTGGYDPKSQTGSLGLGGMF